MTSVQHWRYGAPLVAVAITFLLVESFPPLHERPYPWFLAAILFSAWFGGLWSGLIAVAASAVVLQVALLDSGWSLAEALQFAAFLAVGILVTLVNEKRRRAEAQAGNERRELDNERARLDAVLCRTAGGIVMLEVPSGRIMLHNQPARELMGFSAEADVTLDQYPQALGRKFRHFPSFEQWPIVQSLRTGERAADADLEFVRSNGERAVIHSGAAPIRNQSGEVAAVITTFEDVTSRKVAEESLRFLAETSTTLGASLDYETTLAAITRLAVPRFADWCLLHTRTERGGPRMTASHVDSRKKEILEQLYFKYPLDATAAHGYPHVMHTGEAEFVSEVPPGWASRALDDEHARLLGEIELSSLICVPLRTVKGIFGAVTLAMGDSGRRYAAADLRVAEDFSRRAAQALYNARLCHELEDAHKVRAELLTILTHELRNPLAPMRNALEIMKLAEDRTTVERMQALLERQLAHMTGLIDELVDISRAIGRGDSAPAIAGPKREMSAPSSQKPEPLGDEKDAGVEKKTRALICDDNINAADTLGSLLEIWGYDVRVVYDGASALESVTKSKPDIALLDLTLPGIDGYTVAKRLRERFAACELFLVAITGHGQDEDRRRSHQVGFNHHLVKPVDPEGLRQLLKQRAGSNGGACS